MQSLRFMQRLLKKTFLQHCHICRLLRCCGKIKWHTFADRRQKGIVAGLLFFAHILLHAFVISLTKAADMISVKRLSVIIGLFYGGVIFREKNQAVRTIITLLMVTGAALITIWESRFQVSGISLWHGGPTMGLEFCGLLAASKYAQALVCYRTS